MAMKKCPMCAEDIQDAAIKCRYCGHMLTAALPPGATQDKTISVRKAIGGVMVFMGLWLLFTGASEFYAGTSTKQMVRGTALEQDAGANRISGNYQEAGAIKVVLGLLALVCGGAVTGSSTAASTAHIPASNGPPFYAPDGRPQATSRAREGRPSDGWLILTALLICANLIGAMIALLEHSVVWLVIGLAAGSAGFRIVLPDMGGPMRWAVAGLLAGMCALLVGAIATFA